MAIISSQKTSDAAFAITDADITKNTDADDALATSTDAFDIYLPVEGRYLVDARFTFTSDTTADITFNAGGVEGMTFTEFDVFISQDLGAPALMTAGTPTDLVVADTNAHVVSLNGIVDVSNDGILRTVFAQGTSNASNTVVLANSYVSAKAL